MEVLWFGCMKEVVCNGYDLILHPLFNFEPMKGLEHWGDVRMYGSASNSACKSITSKSTSFPRKRLADGTS